MDDLFRLSELERKLENLIKIGEVIETDNEKHLCRVKSGGLSTNWLPYPALIGKNFKAWMPLRLGQQVILCCPSGDPAQALIVQSLYSDTNTSPSTDDDIDVIQFDNGNKIEHNAGTGKITIKASGDVIIEATERVSGDVFIKGNLQVDGNSVTKGFTATSGMCFNNNGSFDNAEAGVLQCNDIRIRGQLYSTHKHGDVYNGTSETSPPVIAGLNNE